VRLTSSEYQPDPDDDVITAGAYNILTFHYLGYWQEHGTITILIKTKHLIQ